ncbi:hypothetical protein C0991_011362 [Blastosporella zonata]|nr:hypothetical protein C0991_011362 [Blastosporella zonata]
MSTVYAPLPISPAFVNPAHMNATAGPSSPAAKKKPAPCQKRKRTDTPEDSGHESSTQQRKARDGPKKKKANRACFHCQKAHLTCDDCQRYSRPCQRCTKRGIASSCTEGHRKKAKYLLDEDELEQLKRGKSLAPESSQEPAATATITPAVEPFSQTDVLLTTAFDPGFTFGSEAANLEYSILSAILGNPSPESIPSPPSPDPTQSYSSWPSEAIDYTTSPTLGSLSSFTTPYGDSHLTQPSDAAAPTSPLNPTQYLTYPYSAQQPLPRSEEINDAVDFLQYEAGQAPQALHPLQPRFPLDTRPRSPTGTVFLHDPDLSSENPGNNNADPDTDTDTPETSASQLQSIHDRVTKPYDYTEGYHFLMKHLPTRYELEKLMSFSGTPTVVWRRTGEICLVAPEFCMLTEWPMEDLMGGQKYIYEV